MKRLSGFHPTVIALLAGVLVLASVAQSEIVKLSSITLEEGENASTYVMEFSGDVNHQDFLMSNPPRVVIDLMGAQNALQKMTEVGDGKLVKSVRTSQFTNDPELVTRVVFDIEQGTKYRVEKKNNTIEVSFFNPTASAQPKVMGADVGANADFGSNWEAPTKPTKPATQPATQPVTQPATKPATKAATQPTPSADTETSSRTETTSTPQKAPATTPRATTPQSTTSRTTTPATKSWTASQDATKSQSTPSASWSATPPSQEVVMASRPVTARSSMAIGATGSVLANKPITMDVQGADIKTVLRSISEFSGANILAGPEVEGSVTIHLVNVPWKEALDTILKANGYSYRDEYGIYRVQETDVLHQEEIAVVQVERKKEEMQPLVSKVVHLNYANAKEMAQAMKDATTRRGTVQVEKGSNAVIITDIPAYVERVATLCVELDRKVSQVEIVAKLVDVDMEATREMGIRWDFLNLMSSDINANAEATIGQRLVEPYGTFRVGTVQSWGDLMATLDALEKENKANIVSHPRITTADNTEASILVGKEIPLIVSDEAGNPITELKKLGVILRVTPHVNSDQTITMDIHPEVSELSSQATVQGGVIISLTQADTRVIVQDGETAVIGGLINEVESSNENGVPVLKDVPVLGNLFKYSNKVKKKRELIIFITPKVVG